MAALERARPCRKAVKERFKRFVCEKCCGLWKSISRSGNVQVTGAEM